MLSPIFLSTATTTPPEIVAASGPSWSSASHTWSAWDGSQWDISGGTDGVVLQSGVRGMHMPPVQRYSTRAPSVAGTLWRGGVTDERTVFWPMRVFSGDGSQAWVEKNRAFWRTLHPDYTGIWTVTQPSGDWRRLRLRFTEETDDADDLSPELQGWALYGVNLVAEQPYWQGPTVTRTFTSVTGQNYYGGDSGGGYGPPFYITPSDTFASAQVTNDGDVETWPTWTINGPTTSVSVGIAGQTITFPMTLTAGQWVKINTEPTDQVARDQTGADRSAELTNVAFRPIPTGTVSLELTMFGSGSVTVSFTPKFYRAM